MSSDAGDARMARRFRGFLPVVVDVETGGFNASRDALLQIAAVLIEFNSNGHLVRGATHSYHVQPFPGSMQVSGCKRAILVGHNAWFDLSFLNAAVARAGVKRTPFHPFSSFDTATLAGAAFGQTVLAKASTIAGFNWDSSSAHSATYDAERTADLFCAVCNELAESFGRAEHRARDLGWQENVGPAVTLAEDTGANAGADPL